MQPNGAISENPEVPNLPPSLLLSSCHLDAHISEKSAKSLQLSRFTNINHFVCPGHLPKASHQLHAQPSDLTDKAKFRPRGLRPAAQRAPPTREAWLQPKTNKTSLRNKVICTDSPWSWENWIRAPLWRALKCCQEPPATHRPVLWKQLEDAINSPWDVVMTRDHGGLRSRSPREQCMPNLSLSDTFLLLF